MKFSNLSLGSLVAAENISGPESSGASRRQTTLTVVFDNYSYDPDLSTAWGFSCLINGFDKTILFDTGGSGEILLYNMDKLDIRPADIDLVVLSHIHGDHTGGLEKLMKENPNLTVYLPDSFPSSFKKR